VDEPAEYVVRVKSWPAYVLIGLLIVMIPLYGALVWLLVPDDGGWWWIGTVVVLVGGLVQVVAMGWAVRRVLQLVAHRLRISAGGLRLWLLPTATYVDLPWDRVVGVHVAVKGLGRGIFVYVWDPEAFAAGDPSDLRRIRREMRRFFGTPIVYPVSSRRSRLAEVDGALRTYSGGRIGLVDGAPAGRG
jgi:hypothetical protein